MLTPFPALEVLFGDTAPTALPGYSYNQLQDDLFAFEAGFEMAGKAGADRRIWETAESQCVLRNRPCSEAHIGRWGVARGPIGNQLVSIWLG